MRNIIGPDGSHQLSRQQRREVELSHSCSHHRSVDGSDLGLTVEATTGFCDIINDLRINSM